MEAMGPTDDESGALKEDALKETWEMFPNL